MTAKGASKKQIPHFGATLGTGWCNSTSFTITPSEMGKRLPSNPDLHTLARELRKNMTQAECHLWTHIRNRKMHGLTFRRQYVIANYIVDFFCRTMSLAIEVDGISHDTPEAERYDRIRQRELEVLGVTVLRFPDDAILSDLSNVLLSVEGWIDDQMEKENSCSIS